ncbi:TonB-dependent receptor [Ectothiorhodospira shaposhnikovii]|uniref:TonB-dependent receptor n=1 Tax=Ectothiorhodospira shaposhnikovii TaxID=1054 RepID=UPI0019041E63|nr:TonB-dependent receptor [Ectothiorhodospira shaposhnikovii]MBK1674590.1 TonB-dependent receptor [Ectothiorhodospira shaposhnikovii]
MKLKHTARSRRTPVADTRRSPALSGVVVGALVLTGAAQAQAQTVEGQKDAVLQVSETADSTASASYSLPAITVTGEKVERSLQDTSSSVEVFGSWRIETLPNATTVRDVLSLTPNVIDTGHGNDLPTVRGIDGSGPATGAVAFLAGSRPRLNLSVDGRSLTHTEQSVVSVSVWDVESVEIYRGPQSLLQGRNSIAGAIIVDTKDPTPYWENAVRVGVGEQKTRQAAAMLSGPIVDDQVMVRVAIDHQRHESFVKLQSYDPVGNPREFETTTARAKLLIRPIALPDLSSMLTIAHYDSRTPQSEAQPTQPDHPRFDPNRPVIEVASTSSIWDLSWEQSESLSFENKFIYTSFTNDRRTAPSHPSANIEANEFSVEPLARFTADNERLRGMAGLRYFHGSQDELVNNLPPNPPSTYTFDDKTRTKSGFVELTYALIPEVDVTLAGRYEQEHRKRSGANATRSRTIDFDETYSVFMPKLDVAWKPSASQTYGVKVARGFNAGGAGVTFTTGNAYTYDEEYVWNYELYGRQRLADDRVELTGNLFYSTYDGYQLPITLGPGDIEIRNAKKVVTYGLEVGARWRPVPELELFGSAGALRTEIKEAFEDLNADGNALSRSPKFSSTMGATWMLAENFDLSGNVTYTGGYHSGVDNDPRGWIKAHWLANAQFGYDFGHGRASLYVENLFDSNKHLLIFNNDQATPLIQSPRVIGASLTLWF